MKINFIKMNKFIFVITSFISLIAGIIFGITALTNYNEELQFFNSKPIFANILVAIVAIIAVAFAIFTRIKEGKPTSILVKEDSSIINTVLSALMFVLFMFDFISTLLLNQRVLNSNFILYVVTISAALSAVCYVLNLFKINVSVAKEYTMIFPTLWAIFKILIAYFDKTFALNAVMKSLQILTFICIMFYFILEARFLFKKQTIATYSLFSIISSLIIGFAAMWTIILFKSDITTHFQLSETLLVIVIAISAIYSIISYNRIELPIQAKISKEELDEENKENEETND